MDIEKILEENETSRALYEALRALIHEVGECSIRVSKSQVAFRRKRTFAWAWLPAQYLKRSGLAPLVLTVSLPYRDPSPRWKSVIEPSRGRFTHHLELWDPEDLDSEVRDWLQKAWQEAG